MASNSTFPGIFERGKKMSSGIKFCPAASFADASQLRKQSLLKVVVVRWCTYFLVPVLHAGYNRRYYTAFNQFFQFDEDRVQLLECSPASCLQCGSTKSY